MWAFFYLLLQENSFQSDTILRNYLSFSHSAISSLLTYLSLSMSQPIWIQQLIIAVSGSYFVWDTFYICLKQQWKKECLYLYHHAVCLLLLWNLWIGINPYWLTYTVMIGEISNLWNYIVYHMIKMKSSLQLILPMKIIQVGWFSYFRMVCLSSALLTNFHELQGVLLPYNLLVIYGMGLLWGYKQIRSTIQDIYSYIRTPQKI